MKEIRYRLRNNHSRWFVAQDRRWAAQSAMYKKHQHFGKSFVLVCD